MAEPKKAGPACPECGSRDVALRAFSSSIKNARPIGMIWSDLPPDPDGSALLKKKGKMTYRWRCNTCGHKFTAEGYATDLP
jgi:ribosomal protein L37AE/L43A